MGEISNQGLQQSADPGFDLTQFYEVFFEEAGENLASMETLLLEVDVDDPTDDDLNAIFRVAHSVKGGAATFGFADVTELTHQLETLLDKLRRHELSLRRDMIDVLLEAGDVVKAQLARHQGRTDEIPDTTDLVARVKRLASGEVPAPVDEGMRVLRVKIGPLLDAESAQTLAISMAELFRDIPALGTMETLVSGDTEEGALLELAVTTESPDSELLELFSFHCDKDQIRISKFVAEAEKPADVQPAAAVVVVGVAAAAATEPEGYGFFVDPSTLPVTPAGKPVRNKIEKPAAAADATLRVSIEKVDQLINLVGELVITQAMLTQQAKALDPVTYQTLLTGVQDLERNTRSLQDAVMGIRMIPMSFVFSRFPRMLRDLAAKLGKEIELKTLGEATELDKGLIEKIVDPLTHLLRNSADHGIESPERRAAAGKPAVGTITLAASHQGGSILIEVRDDGGGLPRDKILAKAKESNLPGVHDGMTDHEVWQLIWEPGFSTADALTDVSGRGVGMDVVRRNIASLGGSVELDSSYGHGTRVSVRLPLTLAIMDGMSIGVGDEVYILPLSSVIESFQVGKETIKTVGTGGRVVQVRNEYMPVVALDEIFNVPRFDEGDRSEIMVVIEAEGGRVALLVDDLLGQHQVVVKNLEANYRRVPGVSGATILGDGRVALIIDVSSLVKHSRH